MGVNTEDVFNQTMEFVAFMKNNANSTAQKIAPKMFLKSKIWEKEKSHFCMYQHYLLSFEKYPAGEQLISVVRVASD